MQICFCKFRFTKKTTPKRFYRYRIISQDPYDDASAYNGNSIRYQVRQDKQNQQEKRKMFVYVSNNEYLLTYEKIVHIPELENVTLELMEDESVLIPISEDTLDLYAHWVKYYVYCQVVSYCKEHPGTFDYRKENRFEQKLKTPANALEITVKRIFHVDAEVECDGTAYLSISENCEFETNQSIYDLISNQQEVLGLSVKCRWQGFDKSYLLQEVHSTPIYEPINGFDLLAYWKKQAPWRLENINIEAPVVSAYDKQKNRTGYYIPQSLFPVVTREYIAQKDRTLSRQIDQYTKLSMGKRLRVIQDFLHVLNHRVLMIDEKPLPVEHFGYQLMDCSKGAPKLLVANQRRISFKEKYKVFQYGFYRQPDVPVVAAFLSYEEARADSHKVVTAISEFTNHGKVNGVTDTQMLNPLLPLKFVGKAFLYKKGDRLSYEEAVHSVKENGTVNFVIAALPIEQDEEAFYDDTIATPYDGFKRALAKQALPSQMVSIEMLRDFGTNNVKYRLQNLALGILSKSGGIPWVLEREMDGVDCFIGLDVGTQEKGIHYPACSVCLDGRGNLLGYYTTSIAQKGEKIALSTLEEIMNQVLTGFKRSHGSYPKHIVIHRDGFSNEENEWYTHYFNRRNIQYDLVEIRKNISCRILDERQIGNDCNPVSGTAVIKEQKAYIITTDVKNFLGAPRPLMLVHRYGNLSMESIVRQVYVLSEMHVGSMRTSRLPLTTFYADKICKRHDYVPQNQLIDHLYFL